MAPETVMSRAVESATSFGQRSSASPPIATSAAVAARSPARTASLVRIGVNQIPGTPLRAAQGSANEPNDLATMSRRDALGAAAKAAATALSTNDTGSSGSCSVVSHRTASTCQPDSASISAHQYSSGPSTGYLPPGSKTATGGCSLTESDHAKELMPSVSTLAGSTGSQGWYVSSYAHDDGLVAHLLGGLIQAFCATRPTRSRWVFSVALRHNPPEET